MEKHSHKYTTKVVRNERFIQACGNIWLTCLGGRRSSAELGSQER